MATNKKIKQKHAPPKNKKGRGVPVIMPDGESINFHSAITGLKKKREKNLGSGSGARQFSKSSIILMGAGF